MFSFCAAAHSQSVRGHWGGLVLLPLSSEWLTRKQARQWARWGLNLLSDVCLDGQGHWGGEGEQPGRLR